jgi:hypothetical protein
MTGDATMPTREQIIAGILQGTCAWCGKGPFKMLAQHVNKTHGINTRRLRDLAGVTYSAVICSPEHHDRLVEINDVSPLLRAAAEGRRASGPHEISAAGRQIMLAQLEKGRTPWRDEPDSSGRKRVAKARRVAAETRYPCGTKQAYGRGCRCEPCTAAWARYCNERTGARRAVGCGNCGCPKGDHRGSANIGRCQKCACRRWRFPRKGREEES